MHVVFDVGSCVYRIPGLIDLLEIPIILIMSVGHTPRKDWSLYTFQEIVNSATIFMQPAWQYSSVCTASLHHIHLCVKFYCQVHGCTQHLD